MIDENVFVISYFIAQLETPNFRSTLKVLVIKKMFNVFVFYKISDKPAALINMRY